MVRKVAKKTGATVQAQVMMYKSVAQSVLLYGSNSWVMTGSMLKLIDVLCHWVARRIVGMMVRRTTIGEWECSLVAEALDTAGIFPIKEYT